MPFLSDIRNSVRNVVDRVTDVVRSTVNNLSNNISSARSAISETQSQVRQANQTVANARATAERASATATTPQKVQDIASASNRVSESAQSYAAIARDVIRGHQETIDRSQTATRSLQAKVNNFLGISTDLKNAMQSGDPMAKLEQIQRGARRLSTQAKTIGPFPLLTVPLEDRPRDDLSKPLRERVLDEFLHTNQVPNGFYTLSPDDQTWVVHNAKLETTLDINRFLAVNSILLAIPAAIAISITAGLSLPVIGGLLSAARAGLSSSNAAKVEQVIAEGAAEGILARVSLSTKGLISGTSQYVSAAASSLRAELPALFTYRLPTSTAASILKHPLFVPLASATAFALVNVPEWWGWLFGKSGEAVREKFDRLLSSVNSRISNAQSFAISKNYPAAVSSLESTFPLFDEAIIFIDNPGTVIGIEQRQNVEYMRSIFSSVRKQVQLSLNEYRALAGDLAVIPGSFTGRVTDVHDGDTFRMDTAPGGKSIRILGVDALELDKGNDFEKWGAQRQLDLLRGLIQGKTVTVNPDTKTPLDAFGRILGNVILDGSSIGFKLRQGKPGALSISTKPSRASIFLTGESDISSVVATSLFVGLSGSKILHVVPGTYSGTIKLTGYRDFKLPQSITIPADGDFGYPGTIELTSLAEGEPVLSAVDPLNALVSVASSPSNSFIFIDGRYTGRDTPYTFELPAGVYSLHIVKEGVASPVKSVEVMPGINQAVFLDVNTSLSQMDQEGTGTAGISTDPPGAIIFIDGARSDQLTPALFELTAGIHSVIVERTGYQTSSNSIIVEINKPVKLHIDMSKSPDALLPVILVNSDPAKADIYIDSLPTGKRTPTYFEIAPGEHTIRVVLEGFEPAEATVNIGGV